MSEKTSVQALDASGVRQSFKVDRDGDGILTPHHILDVTPVAPIASPSLEASRVLKGSAGTLYALQVNATQTGYAMLFDATAAPADGAVAPLKVWFVNNATQETIDKTFSPPLAMQNGITVVFSTDGPFTKTEAASAHFSAEIA